MRILWNLIKVAIFAGALWFTGKAVIDFYFYRQLDRRTAVSTIDWSIKEISQDHFILNARYTYGVNGTTYQGTNEVESLTYRNRWAAEDGRKAALLKDWEIWYSARKPNYSSLRKNFPFKEVFSAVILWGIVIYLYTLQIYVTKIK